MTTPARARARARVSLAPAGARGESLLAAAEALILERGLRALTVDDVTARAGVAKGTFYLYFAAKEELLAALRARYAAAMRDRQARALAALPAADHGARLDRWIAEAIAGHVEHERLHDALFHHDLPSVALTTGVAVENPQLELLASVLAAGAAAGAFAVADVETATALLYGAMHAAVDLLLGGGHQLDVARVTGATQRFARGAVGAS